MTSRRNDFELESFLPYRVSLLANTISRGFAAHYRERHGISITEWRILAVLGRYPGLTASEIMERTAMDKVAIHRAVKTLVSGGLLERRTDPGDRRRQALHLTNSRGQAVLDDIIPRAQNFERQLLDTLSGEDRDRLYELLDQLQRAAEANLPKP